MAGTGSIERRGKNTFRLVVSDGRDSSGNRIRQTKNITVHATTEKAQEKEAKKALAQFVSEIERGEYYGSAKMPLMEFIKIWLRDHAEKNLAPKTYARYKEILKGRITTAIGHLRLEQIRPAHLVKFYSDLQEDGVRKDGRKGGLANKTIQQHHRILSSMFATAVAWEAMGSNPASKVRPPKVEKSDVGSYDEEQTAALLIALEKEPQDVSKYKTAVILALTTGARRGEIMGLEWQDINYDKGTINIVRTSQYVEGKGIITKSPKNESSKRTVPVPKSIIALLKKHKSAQKKERRKVIDLWKQSDRLFTSWDGSPMHPGTVSKWFKAFLERHKLSPLPFHGLRQPPCLSEKVSSTSQ
ncbi:MAG: site-specific integrase [Clostridiales bacterium]|jgi:integrase|nr:site-specific integrase [Clostridiales bacterium]